MTKGNSPYDLMRCVCERIYFEPQAVTLPSLKIGTCSPDVNEGFPKNNYSKSLFRGKPKRIKPSFLFFRDALSGKHDDYMMSCHSATTHSVLLLLAPATLTLSHLSYLLYSGDVGITKCPLRHRAIPALRVQADLISLCFTGIQDCIVKESRNPASISFKFLHHTHFSLPFLLLSRRLRLQSTVHHLHIKSSSTLHKNEKQALFWFQ